MPRGRLHAQAHQRRAGRGVVFSQFLWCRRASSVCDRVPVWAGHNLELTSLAATAPRRRSRHVGRGILPQKLPRCQPAFALTPPQISHARRVFSEQRRHCISSCSLIRSHTTIHIPTSQVDSRTFRSQTTRQWSLWTLSRQRHKQSAEGSRLDTSTKEGVSRHPLQPAATFIEHKSGACNS